MRARVLFFLACLLSLSAGCGGGEKCSPIALPESWKPHAELLGEGWAVCAVRKGEVNGYDSAGLEALDFHFDEETAHDAAIRFIVAFEDSHPGWKREHQQFLDETMWISWRGADCPEPGEECTFKVQFYEARAGRDQKRGWGFANLESSAFKSAAAGR